MRPYGIPLVVSSNITHAATSPNGPSLRCNRAFREDRGDDEWTPDVFVIWCIHWNRGIELEGEAAAADEALSKVSVECARL